MTFTFPFTTRAEASAKGLYMYEGGTPCPCCGDARRFRLGSSYVCWTCYMGEDYFTKPKTSCATIKKSLERLEVRTKKTIGVLVAGSHTRKSGKVGSRIGS